MEDCKDITLDTIRAEFGEEVAQLVDGVTKLDKLDFTNREEQKAESLRKMILAMSKDIRVVIIKLADRLHNMRTLRFQPEERQKAIAHETLDIYAPLAHRLGMNSIKSELEDLSFKYIDPDAFHDIAQKVGLRRTEREENIRMVISELSEKLDAQHIHYEMDGRPKHLYSIYKKMKGQGKTFDQIYDLIAVRVLVDTVQDCYTVLGIVHTLWNQIPGRFKDYISVPKGNMYQSLHTTVIGGRKMPFPFEIQIRTWEMHRVAEFGVAAHWRYKEGGTGGGDLDNKLYWLRQILDWQGDTRDSQEFIDSLKTDLFSEEVLLFTPKGDIVSMQSGATPSTSPTASTPAWATTAWARRSTAASCRWKLSWRRATGWRSSPRPPPRAPAPTGCAWSKPSRPRPRSASSSSASCAAKTSSRAATCWKRRPSAAAWRSRR